jgi:hypothetical protein
VASLGGRRLGRGYPVAAEAGIKFGTVSYSKYWTKTSKSTHHSLVTLCSFVLCPVHLCTETCHTHMNELATSTALSTANVT